LYRWPVEEKRPTITPQLALRVAILGAVGLFAFTLVFMRLWYLQVLSGDRYLEAANNNRVREIRVQAPRGKVLDRRGEVLVDNRTGLALQIQADRLPADRGERTELFRRLGRVAGMRPKRIEREVRAQLAVLPYSAVTLRHDIDYEQVFYLQEHQREFPGVRVERVFLRRYPKGGLAAHLFGNVGEVTAEQLELPRYRQLDPGDIVGQAGVELSYDRFLRGRGGATRVQVDALGRPKGELAVREAVPGKNLRLTIDSGLQRAGERAVARFGKPAAFVAMDVRNGEVLALGSHPTFDPAVFTRRLSPATYRQLTSNEGGAPLANRATQGLYPSASTFKLITAVAGLEEGLIRPGTPVFDNGEIEVGGVTFKNAGEVKYGLIDLPQALQVSSDVYFYKLGQQAEDAGGEIIQRWARRLGLGRRTGIDLPAEVDGLIPNADWRNRLYRRGLTDRPWTTGDNINLSVGQGDVQITPLQMAVAYASVANGGRVVQPHLGQRIEDIAGRTLQEMKPEPRRRLTISRSSRRAIMEGLRRVAMAPGGTAYEVFGGWPIEIAGKTGTAERGNQGDQAWFVAVAPYDDPRIVVAVTIERGGFGAETAAPATAEILSAHFGVRLRETAEARQQDGRPALQGARE